jgi:hypothetical protein
MAQDLEPLQTVPFQEDVETVTFPQVGGQTNNEPAVLGQFLRVAKKVAAWARREICSFWNMLAR